MGNRRSPSQDLVWKRMAPLRQRGYMRELERLERESYRVAAAVCAGALGALLTCVLFAS